MPYSIITVTFIIDVFIFFRLEYFYKSILLFTVPLLFNIWLNFIQDIASNLNVIYERFFVTHKYLPDGQDSFSFTIRAGISLTQEHQTYYIQEFLKLIPLQGFLDSYYNIENFYKPVMLCFMHSIYIFGWFYIFITNIYL